MSKHYDNCKLFSKDDELLGCCDRKKIRWYLKKGLADIVDDHTIRINFDHKTLNTGTDIDKYRTVSNVTSREEKCVVCGENCGDLETYSLVPGEFKKCYPTEYKKYRGDLIVLTCIECKADSQYFGNLMANEILKEHGYDKRDIMDDHIIKLKIIAQCATKGKLLEKSREILHSYMGDKIDDLNEIKKVAKMSPLKLIDGLNTYQHIIKKIISVDVDSLIAFENKFIQHFYDNMEPSDLPKYLFERIKISEKID